MPERGSRRDDLVLAAVRVLGRNGVTGLTTRAIAREAGVNVATLHYHYGSKDALIAAVMDTVTAQLADTVRAVIPTDGGVAAALDAGLRAVWRLILATPDLQLAQYELTTSALRAPGGRRRAAAQYDAYRSVVEELVRDALNAADEELAVPTEDLVTLLVAGLDGLILQSLVAQDAADRARTDRAFALFITQALQVAAPRPRRVAPSVLVATR